MARSYNISIVFAITLLSAFVSAKSNPPTLDSREIQRLLGNTCQPLAEFDEGHDGMGNSLKSWIGGSCDIPGVQKIGLLASIPSPTLQPTATVTDQTFAITARATLEVREAKPQQLADGVGTALSLLGVAPTADINSQINAAKSQASVINAASISQLSARFMASMQDLQNSAASVVSAANVTMQMALQASASAKQAEVSAENSLMSIQASASSAISSVSMSAGSAISQAMASATLAAGSASSALLRAQAADMRAQQAASLSQSQAESATKIAVAAVVGVVGTSLISIIGFILISRYRKGKLNRANDNNRRSSRQSNYSHRDEKRGSYYSDYKREESRRPITTSSDERIRTRSPKFREEFSIDEQRKPARADESKSPASKIHEVRNQDYDLDHVGDDASVNTAMLLSPERARWPTAEKNYVRPSIRPTNSMNRSYSGNTTRGDIDRRSDFPTPSKTIPEPRNKHITPTFVSRNAKRDSILPNFSRLGKQDSIGVAQ